VSFEDIFGLLVGAGSVPAYGSCSLTLVDIKRFQARSSVSGRNPVPKLAPCGNNRGLAEGALALDTNEFGPSERPSFETT
jgi:hypothetical protein